MMSIPERLDSIRGMMRSRGVTHYLVPSVDEHIDEYLPEWRQRRRYCSGFSGSAGDLLIGMDPAETWLFTDGRYHVQAEDELRGSGIQLARVGLPGVETLLQCLGRLARENGDACAIGVDPMVVPVATFAAMAGAVRNTGAALGAVSPNLVDAVWSERQTPATSRLLACPIEWTGLDTDAKVAQIRGDLADAGADAMVVAKVDQIAWLTNLRSLDDVAFNPVFEAFLYLDRDSIHLFLHAPDSRIPAGYADQVDGLTIHEYDRFVPHLSKLDRARVLVDNSAVTQGIRAALADNSSIRVVVADSPIDARKAIKNDAETAGMRRANLAASAAKTRALLWLERQIEAGNTVTERSFTETLERFYGEIDGFRGLSFGTIAAAAEHGAIIHYQSADDTRLAPDTLFLIDSGIQLDGGTTDATRTTVIGSSDEHQRRAYTRVLQAHIAGATHVFPDGTAGTVIDSVTRAPLWRDRMQYGHGTGHGVGAFLNVHEGPFGLVDPSRMPMAGRGLREGMITSIEPGYYDAELGGIRIENLYRVCRHPETGDSTGDTNGITWLTFEPLNWIPFEMRLIEDSLLDPAERQWIDWYHSRCLEQLSPLLDSGELEQLRRKIAASAPSR